MVITAQKLRLTKEQADALKLDCMGLDIGDKCNDIPCPFCGVDKSFGAFRVNEGITYNCLRVKCGAKGFVPMIGGFQYSAEAAIKRKQKVVLNPYLGATEPLPKSVVTWLSSKYQLTAEDIRLQGWVYDSKNNRIIMPINSYFGYEYGHVAKKLPNSPYKGSKAMNYFNKAEPVKLGYSSTVKQWVGRIKTIVLVEDMISAAKVGRFMNCAALLGTNLTHKQVAFLTAHYNEVIMMLDPDAIGKSLLFSKQYGSLFDSFKIVSLPADPKDTTYHDLCAHLLSA